MNHWPARRWLAVFAENVSLITLHKFGTILFLLDLDRTLLDFLFRVYVKMPLDKILGKIIQIWWLLHIFYTFKWKLLTRTVFVYRTIYKYWSTSGLILSIKLHVKRFPILLKSWIGWKNQSVCKCITIKVRTVWNV